ncbi:MAG: FeoB-associated Cys-rich membrane protein, partial [Clostridia bacterium]|nr:FeoB-associated Cys-rich membrane protein [Clostridia bacterium]
MGYETYIVLAVILLVVGFAVGYIIKEKKKGKKCIGCPYADQCSG